MITITTFALAFELPLLIRAAALCSCSQRKEALESLKADEYVISSDPEQMKKHIGTLDVIICTVATKYNILPYIDLLKPYGKFCVVGVPPHYGQPDIETGDLLNALTFQVSYFYRYH